MFLIGKNSFGISVSTNTDFLCLKNCCIIFHRMHYEIITLVEIIILVEIQGCFSLKKKIVFLKKNCSIKYYRDQSCTCILAHMWLFLLGQYQEVGLLAPMISAVLHGLAKCLIKRQHNVDFWPEISLKGRVAYLSWLHQYIILSNFKI